MTLFIRFLRWVFLALYALLILSLLAMGVSRDIEPRLWILAGLALTLVSLVLGAGTIELLGQSEGADY